MFWLSTTCLTISFRTILRYSLKKVRAHGRNLRFALIVGTNERAYSFARMIEEHRESGYRVAGYVDDYVHVPKQGIELLGSHEDFSEVLRSRIIDEVIIALPIKSQYEMIQSIIDKAEEQGIRVRCLPHLSNNRAYAPGTAMDQRLTVLDVASECQEDGRALAKRGVDVVLGSAFFLSTLPVMLVAAIAIKLTSHGPALFAQDRVGYNKRIFRMYKFRTMVIDAEREQERLEARNEMDGPVFKIQNDPRITRVGRWLRKTSLDELPQLYNVIRGDMSLVGPRPLPLRDYNGFTKDWQRRRFSVRPGLTCLWQINGRNHTSFEDWMKLDMKYIDNWTFLGDMKILVKTIPAVINGKGAA
jgi:exopolysaccharide biosynthesis polyprenyl glycosylphosphotransferase